MRASSSGRAMPRKDVTAMTTESTLAQRAAAGPLAPQVGSNPWADLSILKPFAETDEVRPPRPDALATISAGYKTETNGRTRPATSRDGKIYLHDDEGRAPGLEAILAESPTSLTIAFTSDDPDTIIQQR